MGLFGFAPVSFCIRSATKSCSRPTHAPFEAYLRAFVSVAGLTPLCAREGHFENALFEFEKNLNAKFQKNRRDTPTYIGGIP